jgi:hypothetical protein
MVVVLDCDPDPHVEEQVMVDARSALLEPSVSCEVVTVVDPELSVKHRIAVIVMVAPVAL